MSSIIAECEMHPTEEQLLQYNRDMFRHNGSQRSLILLSVVIFILDILLIFSSQLLFACFTSLCMAAMMVCMCYSLRYSVKKMVKASPHILSPYRIMVTEDAVLELPLVGQLPPYIEVNCPYDKLHEVICTKDFYYFRYNMLSSCIFPRAMLTPEQEGRLCEKLRLFCGERFVFLP